MKRTIYYMIIGYLLLGTGCSDWLSVNPKDKVEQKEMFSDENGFKNALIGNYIMLKDSKLYGKTLTMEFCENLAQHWKTNPQAIDGYTAAYDYKNTEVEELIEEIYGKFYNTIVNINNLLKKCDPPDLSIGLYTPSGLHYIGYLHSQPGRPRWNYIGIRPDGNRRTDSHSGHGT